MFFSLRVQCGQTTFIVLTQCWVCMLHRSCMCATLLNHSLNWRPNYCLTESKWTWYWPPKYVIKALGRITARFNKLYTRSSVSGKPFSHTTTHKTLPENNYSLVHLLFTTVFADSVVLMTSDLLLCLPVNSRWKEILYVYIDAKVGICFKVNPLRLILRRWES